MKSAHFINHKEGIGRIGLETIDAKKNHYASRAWQLSDEEADALKGGWIYLHNTKGEASSIGGKVLKVELAEPSSDGRYVITFEAREGGKGQEWRGQDHGMAWWSGLVDPSATHETCSD